MITPTIDQLRKDITSARTDLTRLETQQEGAVAEKTKLEAEAKELGAADVTELNSKAVAIRADVNAAITSVREEMQSLQEEAPSDE